MMQLQSNDLRGGMKRGRLITLLGGAAAIWPSTVQAAEDVRKLAEQAIRRHNLQATFPNTPEPPPFRFQLPSEVLWLVFVIALGILLYAFRNIAALRL